MVVDVHNHVVGLITRKDLMPFKMQERLESLVEMTATVNADGKYEASYNDRRKSADSIDALYLLAGEQSLSLIHI